jgi:SAM-dependent methyltransferase
MSERDTTLLSGERQVHDNFKGIEYWHKWRYLQALPYVINNTVLDVGCGCGYGSMILSIFASHVIGVDDSQEAIEFARKHWQRANLNYIHTDFLDKFVLPPIQVITIFDVIEHIEDTDAVFAKLREFHLEKIILSVPHTQAPIGDNQFHHRHYSAEELVRRFHAIGYKPLRLEFRYFDRDMKSKNNLNIYSVWERF